MGLEEKVRAGLIEVHNKIDLLLPEMRRETNSEGTQGGTSVAVSALSGVGLSELLELIDRELSHERQIIKLKISLADGATIAWVYRHGDVLKRVDDDSVAHFCVGLSSVDIERLNRLRAASQASQS